MAVPATPPTARQRRRIPAVVHKPGDGRMELDREAIKDGLFIVGLPLLAIVAAFWFTAKYIKPATPDRFVMTTGPEGGAYQLFAREYQKILARDKVTIVLKPSAGSVENLQQLQTPKSDVEAALAQAGIITGEPPSGLRSLGAMYYEPLWIFYRGKEDIDRITQFAGKRVAIGPEGSGTRALALQLLKAGGALTAATELLPLGSNDAVNALIDGHADAALLVASSDAPTVLTLATAKDIKIVSLVQAEAFARRFPFLTVLHLPRGTVDLALDLPAHDTALLATTANLVVTEDFHPALGFLLLEAATEVHGRAGILHKSGEFPAPRESDFPLADEAVRFYKSGPPFLQRYLPFWVANFIQRMLILLVPFFAVLLPTMRFLPMLIEWRAKSRLFKWYGDLQQLEQEISAQPDGAQLDHYMDRLDEIEHGVNNTRISTNHSDWSYNLRSHIDLVRNRLQKLEKLTSQ